MRELMSAASGAALPEEFSGKERVMAAYASAMSAPTVIASGASWVMNRPQRRSGRRTGVAAAAAVSAVLLSGVAAAAATGTLPAPLQHAVHHAWGGSHATAAGTIVAVAHKHSPNASDSESDAPSTESSDPSSDSADPTSAAPRSSSHASGVPAAGTAGGSAAGLCRAWTAHKGEVNPHSALARSLGALAGGSGQIAAYCQTVLA